MGNIIRNIKKITEKERMFGAKNLFVSELVYTTRVNVSLLERIYVLILHFCRKVCLIYFDNVNIRRDFLYNGGIVLIDKAEAFLAGNYILYKSLLYI